MRAVRYSVTARDQLRELLAQGVPRFGAQVVAEKRDRVYDTIDNFLTEFPAVKKPHPDLGLVVYPISQTPFVVLYDFDDSELRVHFIFHKHADLRQLDPTSVEW
jgi:plasmid stabilization system protein ParE